MIMTTHKLGDVLGAMGNLGSTTSTGAFGAPANPPGGPFSGVIGGLIEQTGALDKTAQKAVTGLLDGSGVDVHTAMIATQKSDMAFELALQVRNKAVGAYQQMMSMQF
jgi:flagellar hook-basal body complex protein FliE